MDVSGDSNNIFSDLSGAQLYLEKEVRQNFTHYDPYSAWYFMSVNAHNGGRLYPVDDMRAYAFMLYYLLNCGLPKGKETPMSADVNFDTVKAGKQQAFSEVWTAFTASKYIKKLLMH